MSERGAQRAAIIADKYNVPLPQGESKATPVKPSYLGSRDAMG